jgi:hypothetical protein
MMIPSRNDAELEKNADQRDVTKTAIINASLSNSVNHIWTKFDLASKQGS